MHLLKLCSLLLLDCCLALTTLKYPDDISEASPLPPLPEMSLKGNQVVLEYPAIFEPVIVKTDIDDKGFFVVDYEGPSHLIKQAKAQFVIWSPVAGIFLKEGAAGGAAGGATANTGTVTSSDSGTLRPLHSARKRPIKRKSMDKAPEVMTEEEEKGSISTIMRHARRAIANADESMKEKRLIGIVDGLTSKKLELYGNEYGLERTESGEWTVNEAIDDDIAEKFAFPRMNRASADGGAWSGMQADLTAPTGPTEITDEENTTFGNPKREESEEHFPDVLPGLRCRGDEQHHVPGPLSDGSLRAWLGLGVFFRGDHHHGRHPRPGSSSPILFKPF